APSCSHPASPATAPARPSADEAVPCGHAGQPSAFAVAGHLLASRHLQCRDWTPPGGAARWDSIDRAA
ncbi:MAG TPA: hypothetical protein VMV92_05265, partial [Streptosporangiaceae bacterium]|nr:hypothetical protein [Streptosporangiaceae bacterium]